MALSIKKTQCESRRESNLDDKSSEDLNLPASFIDNLPGIAYRRLNDASWALSYVSDGCLELTGYSRKELLSDHCKFTDLIHGDDIESIKEEFHSITGDGTNFHISYRIRTKNGGVKWIWDTGKYHLDDNGIMNIQGFITDITEQKRIEEHNKSRNSAQRTYQMVLMGLVMSKPFSCGDLNDACCELTQTLVEALAVVRVGIWLLKRENDLVICNDLYDIANQSHIRNITFKLSDCEDLVSSLDSGRVFSVQNIKNDKRIFPLSSHFQVDNPENAMMVAPINFGGSLYGFVTCECNNHSRKWTSDEEIFFAQVVEMVPLALESDARRQTEISLQKAELLNQDYADKLKNKISELTSVNNELKKMNEQMIEVHNQLHQSEKMASIGQLAAGVAHEINNPVGYINSNIETLHNYFADIFRILDVYDLSEEFLISSPDILRNIYEAKEEIKLEYLRTDICDLMNESLEGLTRVKQIVQDLKDFSHVDEAEWQWVDLHKGLDSTLNIVNNEIKYKAEVVKNYGEIPQISCLPSQINQVFMNLLVNAAHAIERDGLITITTGTNDANVWVEISDNGSGIEKENINKLFDPFFTTKPVGSGTGLGLSLSYSIIKKHGGEIAVESEPGEETTFRITLPIETKNDDNQH